MTSFSEIAPEGIGLHESTRNQSGYNGVDLARCCGFQGFRARFQGFRARFHDPSAEFQDSCTIFQDFALRAGPVRLIDGVELAVVPLMQISGFRG
eukprot:1666054-Rhodomonas_salina.1